MKFREIIGKSWGNITYLTQTHGSIGLRHQDYYSPTSMTIEIALAQNAPLSEVSILKDTQPMSCTYNLKKLKTEVNIGEHS